MLQRRDLVMGRDCSLLILCRVQCKLDEANVDGSGKYCSTRLDLFHALDLWSNENDYRLPLSMQYLRLSRLFWMRRPNKSESIVIRRASGLLSRADIALSGVTLMIPSDSRNTNAPKSVGNRIESRLTLDAVELVKRTGNGVHGRLMTGGK